MHPHMSELTLIAAGDDFCITLLHPNPQLQMEKWRGGCAIEQVRNQRHESGGAWLLFSRDLRRRLPVVCLQEDAGKPAKEGPRVEQACRTSASAHGRPACYRNGTEMVDLDLARLGAEDK